MNQTTMPPTTIIEILPEYVKGFDTEPREEITDFPLGWKSKAIETAIDDGTTRAYTFVENCDETSTLKSLPGVYSSWLMKSKKSIER